MDITTVFPVKLGILKNVKILTVDNDVDIGYLYKILLAELGANVTIASSIEQGLDCMNRLLPDIMVSEINFKGERVEPLMERLKDLAIVNGSRIPILVTSTYPKISFGQNLKVGVEAYLLKPFDVDDFVFNIWSLVLLTKISHPTRIQGWSIIPESGENLGNQFVE